MPSAMMKFVASLIAFAAGLVSGFAEEKANPFRGFFPPEVKTVAIVAPASQPSNAEKFEAAVKMLQDAGYKVKVMPHVREAMGKHPYMTISVMKRKADLEQAWMDPEVDFILCVRGGINSQKLVPALDWETLRKRPGMPLLGFSNITALEMAMLKEKAGHPFAGPSLMAIPKLTPECLEATKAVLAGKKPEPVRLKPIRSGEAQGQALAGHIYLLKVMSHTPYRPDAAGKVVFLECPGYGAKKIRDFLQDLLDSGFFKDCNAVVFGNMKGAKAHADEVMKDFADQVTCPVYSGFPYGHTPSNRAIDLTRTVRIDGNGILQQE